MADTDLKPVYLITGSDGPKIETALQRLRARFSPESTEVVSALETTGDDTVALCNAGSLFGDGRLVVVEDVDGRRDGDGRPKGGWKAGDVDAVVDYLGSPAPGTVLALVASDLKKSSALGKACTKVGAILEYSVEKKKIHGWIAGKFEERGVDAEPEACALLVQLVGEDLHALATEVDKLATWAGGEPIGAREIEELTAPTAGLPTYALTDAWGARDASRALDASETLFERESKPRRDTAAAARGNAREPRQPAALDQAPERGRRLLEGGGRAPPVASVSRPEAVFGGRGLLARGARHRRRPARRARRCPQGSEPACARSRGAACARRPHEASGAARRQGAGAKLRRRARKKTSRQRRLSPPATSSAPRCSDGARRARWHGRSSARARDAPLRSGPRRRPPQPTRAASSAS